ncbi:hypothetical protein J7481_19455 [Labrenzia sp. R4_2]|uniref:hypothetical protein n=1 Tax=Labrenzia sp. R4_2 TaxID=2821107 RepID=UPI001ADA91B9|nr:hypothetical protein [Labrenzia sp. R4_2]MBO9421693.1 hypothetical protein [Labrenzia sp. R4_2]
MATVTFASAEELTNALSQLSEQARNAVSRIDRGETDDERVVTISAQFAPALEAADRTALAPSPDDVRTECARRLMETYGARDTDHLTRLINDGVREAVRLLRIGEANWTADQTSRAAELEMAEAYVDAMDAASKALRAMQPIPADYADDVHWPDALTG